MNDSVNHPNKSKDDESDEIVLDNVSEESIDNNKPQNRMNNKSTINNSVDQQIDKEKKNHAKETQDDKQPFSQDQIGDLDIENEIDLEDETEMENDFDYEEEDEEDELPNIKPLDNSIDEYSIPKWYRKNIGTETNNLVKDIYNNYCRENTNDHLLPFVMSALVVFTSYMCKDSNN